MGDRTNLDITIRYIPENKLDEAIKCLEDEIADIGSFESEDEHGAREYKIEQIHGGGYDAHAKLASMGVVFCGSHGVGREYAAYDFVAANGVVIYVNEGGPVASVDAHGNVDQEQVAEGVEYHRLLKQIHSDHWPKMIWSKPTEQSR